MYLSRPRSGTASRPPPAVASRYPGQMGDAHALGPSGPTFVMAGDARSSKTRRWTFRNSSSGSTSGLSSARVQAYDSRTLTLSHINLRPGSSLYSSNLRTVVALESGCARSTLSGHLMRSSLSSMGQHQHQGHWADRGHYQRPEVAPPWHSLGLASPHYPRVWNRTRRWPVCD
jgi:hypothetical protein